MRVSKVAAAMKGMTRAEWAMVVCAMGLATGGLVVAPVALLAWDSGQAEVETPPPPPLPSERQDVLDGLRDLIRSTRAVVRVDCGNASSGCDILLWLDDRRDRGHVNDHELLVLTHSPVLQTITALTVDEQPGPRDKLPRLSTRDLLAPDLVERWRRRGDVGQHLIATGVAAVRVTQTRLDSGEATLRVRLTWGDPTPDEIAHGALHDRESEFSVTLPAIQSGGHAGVW